MRRSATPPAFAELLIDLARLDSLRGDEARGPALVRLAGL